MTPQISAPYFLMRQCMFLRAGGHGTGVPKAWSHTCCLAFVVACCSAAGCVFPLHCRAYGYSPQQQLLCFHQTFSSLLLRYVTRILGTGASGFFNKTLLKCSPCVFLILVSEHFSGKAVPAMLTAMHSIRLLFACDSDCVLSANPGWHARTNPALHGRRVRRCRVRCAVLSDFPCSLDSSCDRNPCVLVCDGIFQTASSGVQGQYF